MQRLSLTDQVAQAVRGEILGGALAPGASLREQVLAARFEVGRSTVREAIKVLVAEGLVTQAHHRGAIVTRHTAADVDDLIAARSMIERHVATADLGDTTAAAEALEAMRRAVDAGDTQAGAEADEAFHRAVVQAAGSPRITAFHSQLAGELRLLLVSADRAQPEPDKVAEHTRLLELLRAGDREGYLAAALHHVARARDTLVRVAGA
ncbi:GntR family transcriptional regulator [Euzebya sp.]|uniref:GntR family transcriptional regulator n=1 Tax=Euzebya sp. TaxID=1971409 RepID=UPI003518F310